MRKILLVASIPPSNATTIEDHVRAIVEFSKFKVTSIDVNDPNISIEISKADGIILHYSIIAYPYRGDHIVSSSLRLQISRSGKPIFHMVQDEQRNVLERFRYFEAIGVKHVFSVASEKVFNLMYPTSLRSFTVSTLLTGYMPIKLDYFSNIEWNNRSIDICYRARRLPEWYGHLGFTKSDISDKLNNVKVDKGFVIDASCEEDDRIYGTKWIDFLCNSRVAVGTESGSSTLDMDGRFLEEWQSKSSIGSFESVDPVVANYAAISPRIFEYAAAKCLLALTPGEYSGIIHPGIHYFELNSDLSNFKDLLLLMKNKNERNRLINNSYEELIFSRKYSYEHMVREVDFWISRYLLESKEIGVIEIKSHTLDLDLNLRSEKKNSVKVKKFLSLPIQLTRTIKVKTYLWSLSRRGVTRFIIRKVYRTLRIIWFSKFMKLLRILLSFNLQLSNEFKKIFTVTRSVLKSTQLIPELEFIRTEAQNLAVQGCSLAVFETHSGVWITWPESLQSKNQLKLHPRLDALHFPNSEGVWLTRSDFSEINKPVHLITLSGYYKKNPVKAIKLIQSFSVPFSV